MLSVCHVCLLQCCRHELQKATHAEAATASMESGRSRDSPVNMTHVSHVNNRVRAYVFWLGQIAASRHNSKLACPLCMQVDHDKKGTVYLRLLRL